MVDNPNSMLGTGSMNQDGSLRIALDDPNDISQERRSDDIGGSDEIQMLYR